MTRKSILALATLTLLVAAVLRIWQLATYPPGPHYDEAAELLIARSIAFGGARFFPMVEAYQGREVLFYYLSVPLLTFVSNTIFSLRLLSVYCNLITIAASLALGRAMFKGRRGLIVGLAIGVLMTLSFPMIWLSRQAFRSSALPLMQALALLFLFKGLNAKRTRYIASLLIVGGIFAGGAIYTYNSSRLFPFWLLLGGIMLLLADRSHWKQRLGQGILFLGATAITALPMAIYAIQRPDIFWGRLGEVTEPSESVTLVQSIVLHLKMFFIAGDPYFRYNDPGRPYFSLPEGILLLIGLALAVYRLTRRSERPVERAAYGLALLSPLMVIPSVISVGGLPPSNMRSLGMVPLIFVLVALGAEWVIVRVERWLSIRNVGAHLRVRPILSEGRHIGLPLLVPLVIVVLLIGGVLVGAEYFRWASVPALFYESDADLDLAAKWLIAQHVNGTPVYLAARDKGHPTVMVQPVPPITWIGTDSLFVPAPGTTGLYIFPRSAPPSPDWAAWLAPGAVPDLPLGPDGQPAFQAYRITGGTSSPVSEARFSARNVNLTLTGFQAPSIASGSDGWITMAWQINQPPSTSDFTPLLLVEDQQGSLIFRGDAYTAGTDEWRAGETLIQRMHVVIPPATPPGTYVLRVAWIGRASNTYVPYFNDQGGLGETWAQIGTLMVTRPTSFPDPAALAIAVPHESQIAPGVNLLGWDALPQSIRPGETLPLTLYWQAINASRSAFTVKVSLKNDQGETAIWTGQPINNVYSADQWANGEILADHARWIIPREQSSGIYSLILSNGNISIALGSINVAGMPRLFDPPVIGHVTNVNFGNKIAIYGYNIHTDNTNLSLEIIWKTLDNMDTDYKVFVHLVDRSGVILTQRDAMPQGNAYPTSLWLPGEYIVDTYELPIAANGYQLQVGLYDPDSAVRLPILDGQQKIMGDFLPISFSNGS
ncbi:MAG TPA: hypothetical protein VHD90_15840 [Phototrophicaceae bacterium]|nr:hypothetical protein [Phototrophicaceae bacterium]